MLGCGAQKNVHLVGEDIGQASLKQIEVFVPWACQAFAIVATGCGGRLKWYTTPTVCLHFNLAGAANLVLEFAVEQSRVDQERILLGRTKQKCFLCPSSLKVEVFLICVGDARIPPY